MTRKDIHVGFPFTREVLDEKAVSLALPRAELPVALPEGEGMGNGGSDGLLGEPLSIVEVARLIGCSVWTVRQQCLPQGLPHFRASRTGKFVFYRNQVIRWLVEGQTKRRW